MKKKVRGYFMIYMSITSLHYRARRRRIISRNIEYLSVPFGRRRFTKNKVLTDPFAHWQLWEIERNKTRLCSIVVSILSGSFSFFPPRGRGEAMLKNEKMAWEGIWIDRRESKKGGLVERRGAKLIWLRGFLFLWTFFAGTGCSREWILAAVGNEDRRGVVSSIPALDYGRRRRCRRRVIPFVGCKSKPQHAVDRRNGHELLSIESLEIASAVL